MKHLQLLGLMVKLMWGSLIWKRFISYFMIVFKLPMNISKRIIRIFECYMHVKSVLNYLDCHYFEKKNQVAVS